MVVARVGRFLVFLRMVVIDVVKVRLGCVGFCTACRVWRWDVRGGTKAALGFGIAGEVER